METFSRRTLANGIRVVMEPRPASPSIALGLWIQRGSRHEPSHWGGITHFIEHLLFKGTSQSDLFQLARQMSLQGGHWNAETSCDAVRVYTRVISEDLRDALLLLREMVWESTFPAVEIERERGVILEEIAQVEDSPEDLCYENLTKRLYGTHPLGRPVVGTVDTVGGMSRQDIVDYWRGILDPGRLVLSLVGGFDPDAAGDLVESLFGTLAPRGGFRGNEDDVPVPHDGLEGNESDLEQVHFCLGVPGHARGNHPRRFAYALVDGILGSGMSSRLFTEVRERRGLAYTIGSSICGMEGAGYFFVYGSSTPSRVGEVLRVIDGELQSMARDGPSPEELDVARRQVERGHLLALEHNGAVMTRNGEREMYHERVLTVQEVLASFRGVTCDDVRAEAHGLFGTAGAAVSLVGPLGDVPDLEESVAGLIGRKDGGR